MKRTCLGFTLIELLVTISIIGIIFGIGVAQYNRFTRRQILVQATQELKSNLRFVQDKAMAGEKDVDVCGSGSGATPLDGWYLAPGGGGYVIFGRCGGIDFGSKTANLSGRGVSISPFPAIRFKPLGQGVVGATTITLTLSSSGETQSVTVTETGEIRYED